MTDRLYQSARLQFKKWLKKTHLYNIYNLIFVQRKYEKYQKNTTASNPIRLPLYNNKGGSRKTKTGSVRDLWLQLLLTLYIVFHFLILSKYWHKFLQKNAAAISPRLPLFSYKGGIFARYFYLQHLAKKSLWIKQNFCFTHI